MSADANVITDEQSRKAPRTRRAAARHTLGDVEPSPAPTDLPDDLYAIWDRVWKAANVAEQDLASGGYIPKLTAGGRAEIAHFHTILTDDGVEREDQWVCNVHLNVRDGLVQFPRQLVDRHQPLVAALEEAGFDLVVENE